MIDQAVIERKALLVGASIYLVLGICGWTVYYLSNSEAILLDGNYNMVNAVASLIGFYVTKIKHRKTARFPLGQFIYESLYALIKGILILGILTAAFWENSLKIFNYLTKGEVHEVNTDSLGVYTIVATLLSFGLARFYMSKNRRLNNGSTMLATDTKSALIDGYLSLFAGGSLLLSEEPFRR